MKEYIVEIESRVRENGLDACSPNYRACAARLSIHVRGATYEDAQAEVQEAIQRLVRNSW